MIDDAQAVTWPPPRPPRRKARPPRRYNVDAAASVGKKIAERALAKGVKQVVFDRGGYIYHGRVKALAEPPAKAASNSKEDTNRWRVRRTTWR